MGNKGAKNKKKDMTVLTEVMRLFSFKDSKHDFYRFQSFKDEIRFLLNNTHYTKEEIQRWHAGFLVN
jgi:hypothetical protein